MPTVWFALIAFMVAVYVLLDGFDLGAGVIHLIAARTPEERRQIVRAVGPVWDGNEVWLLAAGGAIFAAFPLLYASSFSGFYLPLIMVLWMLMMRGLALELLGVAATVVEYVAFADLITRVFLHGDRLGQVGGSLVVLVGAVLARSACAWGREVAAQEAAVRAKLELRARLVRQLLALGICLS